jgi:hypothetical protein
VVFVLSLFSFEVRISLKAHNAIRLLINWWQRRTQPSSVDCKDADTSLFFFFFAILYLPLSLCVYFVALSFFDCATPVYPCSEKREADRLIVRANEQHQ